MERSGCKRMKCWTCGTQLEDPPSGKLSFRSTCDKCYAWLHCCCNCNNYQPGLPNDCKIPRTEYIADRRAANFCEEFSLSGEGPGKTANPEDVSRRLFGEDIEKPKKSFNDLFG
jgi:hypothetical protein